MKARFYYLSIRGESGHVCIRADSHETSSEENERRLVLKLDGEMVASYHADSIRGWRFQIEETDPMQRILDSV